MMTFAEFQSTRRLSTDLRNEEYIGDYFVEVNEPVAGFVYDRSFYVEIRNGVFYAVIENCEYESAALGDIEKILFDYSLVS
jgi:hypothetical protein